MLFSLYTFFFVILSILWLKEVFKTVNNDQKSIIIILIIIVIISRPI